MAKTQKEKKITCMKRYLITCIPHLFMGETQENFLKWPKPLPLISSSAKIKDAGSCGTVMKSLLVKNTINKSKAMVFPVVIYGCESWTVKKAEHQIIDAFELWCWRRLLRVPWTARRSNQSILKEISPGCSLQGLMLMLTLQYFGHFMRRVDSLQKTLMLGGIGGRRRRGQ